MAQLVRSRLSDATRAGGYPVIHMFRTAWPLTFEKSRHVSLLSLPNLLFWRATFISKQLIPNRKKCIGLLFWNSSLVPFPYYGRLH